MRKVTKSLVLLFLLLIVLSGCSRRSVGPTALRQRGLQVQELMNNLQLFVVKVLDSDNRQCQIEVTSNFINMEILLFSEYLFYTVGLKSVVSALHQAMTGDVDPRAIELIRSVEVDPADYTTEGFLHLLENTPQEEINNMEAELNVLQRLWNNCQEESSVFDSGTENILRLSDQEQVLRELFVFWRDNMVTTVSDNNCQQQVKAYLSTNRTLVPFIVNYYSFEFFGSVMSGDASSVGNQDVDMRAEIDTLRNIWNGCEVQGELPQKTDFQREAENMIREMLTFWIENMIPLNSNNRCQQFVRDYIENDEDLSFLIIYLFSNSTENLDTAAYFNQTEDEFLDEMRQKLGILRNNSCL